jgi:tRNA uridine 5-carbamoylmethylation protein Kti12
MLLLLCGLPGAGKSTWTAAVAARLAPRVVVVEFDDFPADTYSASRDICFAIVSSLVKGDKRQVVSSDSLHYDAYCKVVSRWEAAPVNDRILVCDDNFFYSSMRMPYLALAQEGM